MCSAVRRRPERVGGVVPGQGGVERSQPHPASQVPDADQLGAFEPGAGVERRDQLCLYRRGRS